MIVIRTREQVYKSCVSQIFRRGGHLAGERKEGRVFEGSALAMCQIGLFGKGFSIRVNNVEARHAL